MRHLKQGRKFHREKGQRAAFKKSIARNLVMKERIRTTDARAKEMKREIDKLVTIAKKQNIASLRILIARLSKPAAMKLFYDIAPRYADRRGGYTRVTKVSRVRTGDAAAMSVIEFV
jgi:large subunit ribosomal protein L17